MQKEDRKMCNALAMCYSDGFSQRGQLEFFLKELLKCLQ